MCYNIQCNQNRKETKLSYLYGRFHKNIISRIQSALKIVKKTFQFQNSGGLKFLTIFFKHFNNVLFICCLFIIIVGYISEERYRQRF